MPELPKAAAVVASRAVAAGAFGFVLAFGWCFLFVLAYAIANLYFSGHGIKPTWFDQAADITLPVSALAVWATASVITWRSQSTVTAAAALLGVSLEGVRTEGGANAT